MIKKIKKVVWQFLNFLKIGAHVQLALRSNLKDEGWFKSFYKKQAIDKEGQPIPWFTYSAVHFLSKRLDKSFEVFEYGCGNSTLWLAQRVKNVDAVEGDKDWIAYLQNKIPANVRLIYYPVEENQNGKYAQAISEMGKKYDLVIVDGRDRNNCVIQAEKFLGEKGVIILDNSDRPDYQTSIDFLLEKGYRKIDFIGNTAIVSIISSTSVFYKDNNCLGI
ncbi:MAG: FkbM family methyltransferase [Thermonemataceae bacterium]|nr:FkbM family methyltransferase [Thermonemataceae bacterium]